MAAKTIAGIDMERNYVTVTVCIVTSCYSNVSDGSHRRRPPQRSIHRIHYVAPTCTPMYTWFYGAMVVCLPSCFAQLLMDVTNAQTDKQTDL